jgi:hypothetical protein
VTEEKMRGVFIDKPWFWLLFQATCLCIVFIRFEQFQLIPVDVDGYWYWATVLDWSSLTNVLSIRRTFAYPLFLKGVHFLSPSFTALPVCQLALRLLAVLAFYGGLRSIKFSGWLAMIISSSLLYPETIILETISPYFAGGLTTRLMSDSPAQSLAILTMGALLMVIGRSRNLFAWSVLTGSLFLTYQFRPAYLFLIPLVPLLGVVLFGMITPGPTMLRRCLYVGLGLGAVCSLPFLGFCTYRGAKVGHFGLVSIGGSSLIGIAGQFLTEEIVPELPEDLHPLALRALEERKKWAVGQTPDRLVFEGGWQPPFDSNNNLRPGVVEDGTTAVNTQFLFEGVASELYEYKDVDVNRKLSELSRAIIKAKPRFYLLWLVESFRVAVIGVVKYNYVPGPLLVLLSVLLFIWGAALIDKRLRRSFVTAGNKWNTRGDYSLELMVLVLIAVSFALAKILVIVPVATPERRYLAAAGVFFPTVAVMIPVAVWGQIRSLLLHRRTRDKALRVH